MYIVVLILLIIAVISPKILRVNIDIVYRPLFILLTLLLCLRYGQGSDYFSYKYLYELSSGSFKFDDYFKYLLISHGQILWQTLTFISNVLCLNYEYFVVLLSVFEMLLLSRFIEKFCYNNKCFALLLLYPTIYLTYLHSAYRQGLVVCIFLGIMLCLINNK